MAPCGSPVIPNPDAYYEPNSLNGPVQDERFREPPAENLRPMPTATITATATTTIVSPCDLFRLMTAAQKEQLFQNYKAAMQGVPVEIVKRQIVHCYRADPEYGAGVREGDGHQFHAADGRRRVTALTLAGGGAHRAVGHPPNQPWPQS